MQTTRSRRTVAWTDINFAVWYTFDQDTTLTQGALVWLAQAQQEANLGFPGVDFYQVGIYTPVNQFDPDPNGPQEFLTVLPKQRKVTPEPGTLLLLGSGLAGLWARKRLT